MSSATRAAKTRRKPRVVSKASVVRRKADAALERRLRPIVGKLVAEMLEDRLDSLESEASLADGAPVPADEVWKRLGI
jgi:hypothetical protein